MLSLPVAENEAVHSATEIVYLDTEINFQYLQENITKGNLNFLSTGSAREQSY